MTCASSCRASVSILLSVFVAAAAGALSSMAAIASASARPRLFLVGGPSGAGKDTLLLGAQAALEGDLGVEFVTRDVTRDEARCTELERSVTRETFAAREAEYAVTWSAHGTTDYGVRRTAIDVALARGAGPQKSASMSLQLVCFAIT